jgi:hypothetical protein
MGRTRSRTMLYLAAGVQAALAAAWMNSCSSKRGDYDGLSSQRTCFERTHECQGAAAVGITPAWTRSW